MLYYIAMMNEETNYLSSFPPECADLHTSFHYSFLEIVHSTKYVSEMHYHNLYELYFLEQGNREYIVNGKVYPVEAGTLVIIPPGILHETSGQAFSRRLIHFSRECLEEFLDKKTVDSLLSACSAPIRIPNEKMPLKNVEAIFQQVRIYFQNGDVEGCALATANLLHGLKKMTEGKTKSASTSDKLIEQISLYIQENATQIQNLEEISNRFFISKSHLCHLFKQQKHTTVYDFLLKIKIEKAATLLTTTKKKIKDICNECGFNSEYYFSRRFLLATGISPSKYRKEFSNYGH